MKNWKTTLAGLAAGILNLIASGTNWKSALVSVGLATIGLASKDHDVTGGKR